MRLLSSSSVLLISVGTGKKTQVEKASADCLLFGLIWTLSAAAETYFISMPSNKPGAVSIDDFIAERKALRVGKDIDVEFAVAAFEAGLAVHAVLGPQ